MPKSKLIIRLLFRVSIITFVGVLMPLYASTMDISSQWTFVKGATQARDLGSYGEKGVAAAANSPSARDGLVFWTDMSGHLWMYGGVGMKDAINAGGLNQLWMFDPSTNYWTFVKGSTQGSTSAVYGSKKVSRHPRTRQEHEITPFHGRTFPGTSGYLVDIEMGI